MSAETKPAPDETPEPRRSRSLSALRPLLPYALRNKGRIGLALIALTIASAATPSIITTIS